MSLGWVSSRIGLSQHQVPRRSVCWQCTCRLNFYVCVPHSKTRQYPHSFWIGLNHEVPSVCCKVQRKCLTQVYMPQIKLKQKTRVLNRYSTWISTLDVYWWVLLFAGVGFNFDFAILVAGFKSHSIQHSSMYSTSNPITMPTLHVFGDTDRVIEKGMIYPTWFKICLKKITHWTVWHFRDEWRPVAVFCWSCGS